MINTSVVWFVICVVFFVAERLTKLTHHYSIVGESELWFESGILSIVYQNYPLPSYSDFIDMHLTIANFSSDFPEVGYLLGNFSKNNHVRRKLSNITLA